MPSYTQYKRQMATIDTEFHEEDHPRDQDGKFTSGGRMNGSISQSAQEKKTSITIDFTKDNILPKLNEETIKELGPDADKPVLFKKRTIDRNLEQHPEVKQSEYSSAVGQALYNPEVAGRADPNKPYYNLISRVGDKKSSVVILDIQCNKSHCEIVHVHYLRNKSRKTMINKMKRITKETSD